MATITLDIKQLNEERFEYLRKIFRDPAFEGDDFDAFYAYLSYLDDTEIVVENYTEMIDFSYAILRLINEVNEDYGNLMLSFGELYEDEHRNKIILDIEELKKTGHDYLKELFEFPDYYGKNLDALYDCLGDLGNTEVIVINCDDLDEFSLKVLKVLDEAADEFGNIRISYEYEEE